MNLNAKTYFSMADENKELKEKVKKLENEKLGMLQRVNKLLDVILKALEVEGVKEAIIDDWSEYKILDEEVGKIEHMLD